MPSWGPGGPPDEPAAATVPAQAAVFGCAALAVVLLCVAVGQAPYALLGVAALAIGVALGLGTSAGRLVRTFSGLVAAFLAMVLTGLVLVLAAIGGLGALVVPGTIPLVGLVVVGLDWTRVARLRVLPFVSGSFVVASVSLERGWAYPAAVVWLATAILALWLLQNDERRALRRPAPLLAAGEASDVRSVDLVRTLGLALLLGVAAALVLGNPSCSGSPDAIDPPGQFRPDGIDPPVDPSFDPSFDPSLDPSGGERPARPGEVPPEYRGDERGGGTGTEPSAGEVRTQVDEDGNRYFEDPGTGERYRINEEGGRSVIRDEDGEVVGELDEQGDGGVVARDGAGTEQRYRADEDGRLYTEGPGGERYYLEEGPDGRPVLRDGDGEVVAAPGPGDADDHLVIRDPDGEVLVPDPNGDGEIPIPNGGIRDGLPGWTGRTEYSRDDGTVVATDPDGETRTYDRDWVGRDRVRVERPGEPTRVFVYDETGPFLTVIEYDGEGRFVRRYRYDPDGVIVGTDADGEERTYDIGEGPEGAEVDPDADGYGGGTVPDQDEPADPEADPDHERSLTPWLVGGAAAIALAGLGGWLLHRRRRPARPEPAERSVAEAIIARLEAHGTAHGRPRRTAETVTAYTRSLGDGPLPDPRLADVGRLLSRALFGAAAPSVDELQHADAVVTEVIEAHPDPATVERRHRTRPPATTAGPR